MIITVSVPDQFVHLATQHGLSVEAYVERLLADADIPSTSEPAWARFGPGPLTPRQAADDIRELRKELTLGGLSIKDLINEGCKY